MSQSAKQYLQNSIPDIFLIAMHFKIGQFVLVYKQNGINELHP